MEGVPIKKTHIVFFFIDWILFYVQRFSFILLLLKPAHAAVKALMLLPIHLTNICHAECFIVPFL